MAQNTDTITEAVFATIKDNAVSYHTVVFAPDRQSAARQVARLLKERMEGSLLDIALAEADDVRAVCREVPMDNYYANI
jgi:hypothetical protein